LDFAIERRWQPLQQWLPAWQPTEIPHRQSWACHSTVSPQEEETHGKQVLQLHCEVSKVGQPREASADRFRYREMLQRCEGMNGNEMRKLRVELWKQTPPIKHFKTCARDKICFVKTVRRARIALHFHLAKMGQTAQHLNDTIQIDKIIRPGVKYFKQLARH
jgi:hypothetical protein